MNDRRHLIILPALCWNQRRRDFYAITTDISVEGIRFRSASVLSPGEDLTCSIRHIGLFEARIDRASNRNLSPRFAAGLRPWRGWRGNS